MSNVCQVAASCRSLDPPFLRVLGSDFRFAFRSLFVAVACVCVCTQIRSRSHVWVTAKKKGSRSKRARAAAGALERKIPQTKAATAVLVNGGSDDGCRAHAHTPRRTQRRMGGRIAAVQFGLSRGLDRSEPTAHVKRQASADAATRTRTKEKKKNRSQRKKKRVSKLDVWEDGELRGAECQRVWGCGPTGEVGERRPRDTTNRPWCVSFSVSLRLQRRPGGKRGCEGETQEARLHLRQWKVACFFSFREGEEGGGRVRT